MKTKVLSMMLAAAIGVTMMAGSVMDADEKT